MRVPHDFVRAVRYSYGGPLGAWLNKAEEILGPLLLCQIVSWPKGGKWVKWKTSKAKRRSKRMGYEAQQDSLAEVRDQSGPVRENALDSEGEVWHL